MNLFEKLVKYRREKHLGQCGHNMFAIEQHRAMADYLAREVADEVPVLIRSLHAIARRPYTSADDLAADILAALGASAEEVEARSRGVSDE